MPGCTLAFILDSWPSFHWRYAIPGRAQVGRRLELYKVGRLKESLGHGHHLGY